MLRGSPRCGHLCQYLTFLQPRLDGHRHLAEGGRRALHLQRLAVLQPALGCREEQPEGVGPAIVVHIPVLHQQIAKHPEEERISCAVRREIHLPTELVQRFRVCPLRTDEGIAGESLRELAVEADQGPVNFVALQELQNVAKSIQIVYVLLHHPEGRGRVRAHHAHHQAALLLEIVQNPLGGFRVVLENA